MKTAFNITVITVLFILGCNVNCVGQDSKKTIQLDNNYNAKPVANSKLLYNINQFYSLRTIGKDTVLARIYIAHHLNFSNYRAPDTTYYIDKANLGKPLEIVSYKDGYKERFLLAKFPAEYLIVINSGTPLSEELDWKYFKSKKRFNAYARRHKIPLERTKDW